MFEKIYNQTEKYFSNLIMKHGPTNQGIGWNSMESQILRYSQICKVIDWNVGDNTFSVCDYGCGYGRLYEYLLENVKDRDCLKYIGLDISEQMIKNAKELYGENCEQHNFYKISETDEIEECDYIVSSGVLNLKQEIKYKEWTEYIIHILNTFDKKSRKGFSFNCLTKYSDKELMKDDLYYGDPLYFFDYCKKNFSRNVALLHDYDLYEFTILVRK